MQFRGDMRRLLALSLALALFAPLAASAAIGEASGVPDALTPPREPGTPRAPSPPRTLDEANGERCEDGPIPLRVVRDARRADLLVMVETLCEARADATPASAASPGDGCTATSYSLTNHRWNKPYVARVDARGGGLADAVVLAAMRDAGQAWEDVANADLLGSVATGGDGTRAGIIDGVNQIGFQPMGGAGILARTTTWFSASGIASESDIVFNDHYLYASGAVSGRPDLQSVATHEIGHTFGLGHAADVAANACLTMFPSGTMGSTRARTLGTGDILGAERIYGARTAPPAPAPEPVPPSQPAPFTASFQPKPGNAWWVEVVVDAARTVASVTASVNGGTPQPLVQKTWGSWAQSFHVPEGATVVFTATASDGARSTSGAYRWPDAVPVTTAPPAPAPFAAEFRPKAGNEWWVEVDVSATRALSGVSVRVDGGAPVLLEARAWGAWARSFHVPPGSVLTFTATAADGASSVSDKYRWPDATPVASPAPLAATFAKHAGNEWWVEVRVDASRPLAGVTASVAGGGTIALEPRPWGTWGRSIHVPPGASIVFTATAQDGAQARSAPIVWS